MGRRVKVDNDVPEVNSKNIILTKFGFYQPAGDIDTIMKKENNKIVILLRHRKSSINTPPIKCVLTMLLASMIRLRNIEVFTSSIIPDLSQLEAQSRK